MKKGPQRVKVDTAYKGPGEGAENGALVPPSATDVHTVNHCIVLPAPGFTAYPSQPPSILPV